MSSNIRGWARHGKTDVDALSINGKPFSGNAADLNIVAGQAAAGVKMPRSVVVPLAGGNDAAGGLGAWANPEPGPIVVSRVTVDITTIANAACTLKAGSAANKTTASANLIDTLDVRTSVITASNISNPGTNGKALQRVAAGAAVTFSTASGASAGLAGNAVIEYTPLT
ncbi:hypothetical protein [Singulisphaera sp. PoT]|uniref:hypothetical protein n=1 Tax=Singulisphaera sp. PoT TaxID=3411797 RepID=UPI003BF4A068